MSGAGKLWFRRCDKCGGGRVDHEGPPEEPVNPKCSQCGSTEPGELIDLETTCSGCGAEYDPGNEPCPECGTDLYG